MVALLFVFRCESRRRRRALESRLSSGPRSSEILKMAHQGRPQALDVEGGKAYAEPSAAPVNNDTILPTYRNGEGSDQKRSPSGSVSDDQKHAREVDLDALEPPHEQKHSEKSAFTKKLDNYAHLKRPIIHAFMVAFCLGEWRWVLLVV